ncbi:zinc-dependent metalloprotease [Paraferrimonas haliotis]|uniref:EcxA zinc-binding domain-containing protein n=1 Tax=Paraferrimonas haliotis TaxID=2013866 RepID=A0AA37TK44_9GAMM|nr:zinc-dependent metalloprotease [Paraferrimonas haliotis]GLS82694.1 hypothetical protein GCM10007894_06710 [Paraferrimonas haliotis]
MFKRTLLVAAVGTFVLAGCGVDEPYKEVKRDEKMISVADFQSATTTPADASATGVTTTTTGEIAVKDPERKFLMIRSVGETPRYAAALKGFLQGNEKVVTLRMTQNGIQVRQLDSDNIGLNHDSRYDNEYNMAPVLTIPGQYVDYQCSKDNWGECTNREEEVNDRDVTWDQKSYFIPQFEQTKIAEESFTDLITFMQCTSETEAPRLVQDGNWKGYEMDLEKGVINFEIEHTYQATPSCFGKFYNGSVDNLSFTTTEYISIVALDQLASDNYVEIPYSEDENGTFGFFRKQHSYRDGNNAADSDGFVRSYLERFNPKQDSITYYLSNNFYEAKNLPFLDAAKQSVALINAQNEWAQTGLPTIKLEQANDKRHGDLRYSNITLFDEPLDNGLAGYGPSAANPLTGEIVSGRVDQYSANLEQGAVRYYRRVQLDYNRGMLDPQSVEALTGVPYTASPEAVKLAETAAQNRPATVAAAKAQNNNGDDMLAQPMQNEGKELPAATLPSMLDEDSSSLEKLFADNEKIQEFFHEHNVMTVDTAYGLAGGALRELPKGLQDHQIDWTDANFWVDGVVGGKLKDIKEMPVDFQQDLVTKLAAQAFSGTLTHELGHNFGLRHNFAGSRDMDNFFNEDELAQLDKAFAAAGYPDVTAKADFSSQMDYNLDRFATTFEAYDLAALRFGYARKVETQDGQLVSLKDQDQKRRQELAAGILNGETQFGALYNVARDNNLRRFGYCTDGHVSLNSNCNRFDAGVTNEDIEKTYVDAYNDSYYTQNTRYGRQTLFEDHVFNYTLNRMRTFNNIRQFVEDTSSVSNLFDLSHAELWQMCDSRPEYWFCASKRAVDLAADTFLKAAGLGDAYITVRYTTNDRVDYKDNLGNDVHVDAGTYLFTNTYSLEEVINKMYRLNGSNLDKGFAPGELVTNLESDSQKAILAELLVKSNLKAEFADKTDVDMTFNNGRLLNGVKAPESNPNHPYVNERDVLGMWPDKLLAVRNLVTRTTNRRTTSRTNYALVDDPKVAYQFKNMLCRMTMGATAQYELGENIDTLNFGITHPQLQSLVNSTAFTSPCGDVNNKYYKDGSKYFKADVDYADQEIEALPDYQTALGRYFGFPVNAYEMKGKTNLLKMVLKQVQLASVDSDTVGEEKARVWREFVGIHLDNSYVDSVATVQVNGKVYAATAENTLALNLINQIKQLEDLKQNSPGLMTYTLNRVPVPQLIEDTIARDKRVLSYLPVLD